jgi:hypothetical protein
MTPEQEKYARWLAPKALAVVPVISMHEGKLALTGLTRDDAQMLLGARTSLPLVLEELDRVRGMVNPQEEGFA